MAADPTTSFDHVRKEIRAFKEEVKRLSEGKYNGVERWSIQKEGRLEHQFKRILKQINELLDNRFEGNDVRLKYLQVWKQRLEEIHHDSAGRIRVDQLLGTAA